MHLLIVLLFLFILFIEESLYDNYLSSFIVLSVNEVMELEGEIHIGEM